MLIDLVSRKDHFIVWDQKIGRPEVSPEGQTSQNVFHAKFSNFLNAKTLSYL